MKKIFLFLALLINSLMFSQATCATAMPFCAAGISGITFPASTSTPAVNAQVGPNYGCLYTTPNPAWYYLQISNPGNLDILIQGTITTPPTGPGSDVDFICWGPFSSLPGACNNLTAANTIDCSYSGSFTETLNIVGATTGQYYMVLITNFANISQSIIFQQFGGTGSTNCALIAANSAICAGSTGTVVGTNASNLTNPSFSIQPGGVVNGSGIFTVTPVATTNYTVYVTGSNNANPPVVVTQTAVSTVTVKPQPSAVPTTTQSTCTSTLNSFNLGLTFNPSTPAPNYTITWSSIPAGILTPQQFTANSTSPGTYAATITAAGGCSTIANFSISPQPSIPVFTITPFGTSFLVTCIQPTLTLTASNQTYNYNWVNGVSLPQTGFSAYFSAINLGTWSVIATDPVSNCSKTHTFTVAQSTITPTSTITPLSQLITCTNTAIQTITATCNPTLNIQHQFMAPQGGTVSINSPTAIFTPGPGTYTHVLVNLINGCKSTKTFSVNTSSGFPTFNVLSPQAFTLGCGTHSVITINVPNANTTPNPGGTLSYTLLPPGTGTNYGFSSSSTWTNVTVPGTWTVIVKDAISLCETKVPISVIQNTFGPQIDAIVPNQTLTCYSPTVLLEGISETPNVSYNWSFPTAPGNLQGSPILVVATANTSNTFVAMYTLTIIDLNNTCKSNTLIPIYQNMFPPKVGIAKSRLDVTCSSPTVVLTNTSTSNSPLNFPQTEIIQGYIWQGPPPQSDLQVSSTYVGSLPGTYSLTAKDLNNGCVATATVFISDNRIFPVVNNPLAPPPFFLDCGEKSVIINAIVSNPINFTYLWIPPVTSTIGVVTNSVLIVNFPGIYKIQVKNESSGCVSNGTVSVVTGSLNANFIPEPISGFAPLTVNFQNNSSSSGTGTTAIQAVWNFGNGNTTTYTLNNVSPNMIYTQPGTYTVTLYANKGTSCQNIISKIITVDIPSKIEIPNVFTPNGDGSNDLFFVQAANLTTITALIFDRWGNKVYELISNTGNIAWDGKNQSGSEVAEGTYFYIIKATGKDGVAYDTKGNVSLYR